MYTPFEGACTVTHCAGDDVLEETNYLLFTFPEAIMKGAI